jgi:alpha-galactosidase
MKKNGNKMIRCFARPAALGALLLLLLTSALPVNALNDGLARTPPMGWNSWNTFFGGISESLILQAANAMVSSGMKDAGFRYIVLDDGWNNGRDGGTKKPIEDKAKFPHGFKYLTDSIHALGLKAGIYTAVGSKTCLGLTGSLDNEPVDAQQYADWGFDFLKNDWCKNVPSGELVDKPMILYSRMKNAIKKTGRPIVLSICEKGQSGLKTPWTWPDSVGHMWRTTNDINASFSTVTGRCVNGNADLVPYAHPGGFNDPDMLEVGNASNGMTETEFESHFSLWCVMASPLMAGNDIRSMTAKVKSILTNKDAVAVDQDSLGAQGQRIVNDASGAMVFVKKMKNTATRAVLLFNNSGANMTMSIKWTDTNMGWKATDKVTVFDIWSKAKTTGVTTGYTSTNIPKHGNAFLLLTNEDVAVATQPGDRNWTRNPPALRHTDAGLQIVFPITSGKHTLVVTDMLGKRAVYQQAQPGIFSIDKRTLAPGILFAALESNSIPVYSWRIANTD